MVNLTYFFNIFLIFLFVAVLVFESLYTLALKQAFEYFDVVICNLSVKNSILYKVRLILKNDHKSKLRYRNQYTLNQLHFIEATPAELMVSLEDKVNEIYDVRCGDDDFYYY